METKQIDDSKSKFTATVKQTLQDEMSKATNSTEKGNRFLTWAIKRLVDASDDEIKNQIVDGSNDEGIDAWIKPDIESEDNGIIQLFQSKFNESHDDSKIVKFQEDVNKFLEKNVDEIPRDELKQLHQLIKNEHLEPELYYITDKEVAYKSTNPQLKIYDINKIIDKLWSDLSGITKGVNENIHLEKYLEYDGTIIGVLSLSRLRKFIEKTKDYIYESNIRKYLQRTKINKGLRTTLQNSANSVFYYNNGITIVVKDFQVNGEEITLIEPQIVNGAQTSQTIYERLPLISNVQGNIQVSIIKESNKTTRRDITQFRNSQNSVKGKDLISLQSYHTGIRGQLKEIGYFYQQQAGSWNYIKDKQPNYKGHETFRNYLPKTHPNMIEASTAIQAMVAGIFQNPTKSYSSLSSFMPNGTQYPKIFDSKLPEDYRLLFFPYLVKCYSETLGYGFEEDPPQKRYARLLFVTVYFRIIFDHILKKSLDVIKLNPELLEPIFKNFEVNQEILSLTDETMTYYFSRAREYYNDHDEIVTWHNFFSHHAWNPELQKSIKSFLTDHASKIKEIKAKLK